MPGSISATRTAALVARFDRRPAYQGLARALVELIGDGRIPPGTRLPSERDLTAPLGVSRTTVTRAYAVLRDSGYAEARRGAGTFTRTPGAASRVLDRALNPRQEAEVALDLSCAATSAPPGLAAVYAAAVEQLPAHLGGHGYYPAGLPALQEAVAAGYTARGLPTDPGQVVVTPGALSAVAIIGRALATPGGRALVESPSYPNAAQSLRQAGLRLRTVPVDPDGWDLDAVGAAVRQAGAQLAYLVPEFQNPTGHLMSDEQRAAYAAHLAAAGTVAVVDEAHQWLRLDDGPTPLPFAAHAAQTLSVGSLSKGFWGGRRVGWIRAPHAQVERLTSARLGLDLGVPVLEQLVATRLLEQPEATLAAHRERLRDQRDRLVAALAEHLPGWRFRVPAGGLVLWCELPSGSATAVAAAAERRGVAIAPGPVFAPEGGLDRYLRLPWTRPGAELEEAVRRLAAAWREVPERPAVTRRGARVIVA